MEVPFEPAAVSFAVESAVETGQPLVVVNVVEIALSLYSIILGLDGGETDEDARSLARPAELAASLGVPVQRFRLRTPRPVEALVEFAAECQPGVLCFGPDRSRLRPKVYRKAAHAMRERCSCLVWLAE